MSSYECSRAWWSIVAANVLAALVAGYIAIAARKGGTWHRRSGTVFVYAMLAMGLAAVGIAVVGTAGDVLVVQPIKHLIDVKARPQEPASDTSAL